MFPLLFTTTMVRFIHSHVFSVCMRLFFFLNISSITYLTLNMTGVQNRQNEFRRDKLRSEPFPSNTIVLESCNVVTDGL